jgi:fatty acid desaturase
MYLKLNLEQKNNIGIGILQQTSNQGFFVHFHDCLHGISISNHETINRHVISISSSMLVPPSTIVGARSSASAT